MDAHWNVIETNMHASSVNAQIRIKCYSFSVKTPEGHVMRIEFECASKNPQRQLLYITVTHGTCMQFVCTVRCWWPITNKWSCCCIYVHTYVHSPYISVLIFATYSERAGCALGGLTTTTGKGWLKGAWVTSHHSCIEYRTTYVQRRISKRCQAYRQL